MNQSLVTLASTLQVKGEALSQEEMWSLLFLASEQILEDLNKGSSNYVVCPWSTLLHASGSLSFHDNASFIEATPFKAPEILQGQHQNTRFEISKVHVYSLGMTLYWSAEFRVPPNQPLQLSEPLLSILLMMCEDLPEKRPSLPFILEACCVHQKEVAISLTHLYIKRLVSLVLGNITEMEQIVVEERKFVQQNRSDMIRRRLHQKQSELSLPSTQQTLDPERNTLQLSSWEFQLNASAHENSKFFLSGSASMIKDEVPQGIQQDSKLSLESTFSVTPKRSSSVVSSQRCLLQKEQILRPEFIQLTREIPVTLQLPGSIVTKKGKLYLSQRELYVVLLNGQCLEVKCDIKSKARDVFNLVSTYANLTEHFYFGLAFQKGKEFFFLDDETKLCEIAPEGWNDRSKKKTTIINFTLYLRIKFFVNHFHLIHHSLTRHQFYLQLRKDILEERIYCSDEMLLQLGALALQVEFGNYSPEQAQGKYSFLVEDYIPASMIERMTAPCVQSEVLKIHSCYGPLSREEVELEFLKLTQKLPEYGVFFYRVFQEKKMPEAEMTLGICAKGIIVYEVKNNSRIASLRFQWREMGKISTQRKKFTIESNITGKKHTFITDTVKTCKYLLDLCSDQHRFNAQMSSGQFSQVLSEVNHFTQMVKSDSANVPQRECLPLIQRLSCSENMLLGSNLENTSGRLLSKSWDSFNMEPGHRVGDEGNQPSPSFGWSEPEPCFYITENQRMGLSAQLAQNIVPDPQNPQRENFLTGLEREIICVTLKRDPQHGFGFVIIGSENVGQLDLGIFIASIIPGGPAERTKMIKPGGRIISLNNISLEGVTFNRAVKIIENSPDKVDLIVSQPKGDDFDMVARLVLERRDRRPAEQCPSADDRKKDECVAVSLATTLPDNPESFALVTDDNTFEVTLKKNSSGLGFSFLQMARESSDHLRSYVVRIKRLFPGQPAEENGEIAVGDIILAVNGKPTQGLSYQDVLHLLRGAPDKVTLRLCRPLKGTLPEIDQDLLGHGENEISCGNTNMLLLPDVSSELNMVADSKKDPSVFLGPEDFPEIALVKDSDGQLGLKLTGDAEGEVQGIYVLEIVPGSPASREGSLQPNDRILSVCGVWMEGCSLNEALQVCEAAGHTVHIRAVRAVTAVDTAAARALCLWIPVVSLGMPALGLSRKGEIANLSP
ncbi:FERM and PDZ domain-containing protein 2 [Gracilinanus agilis]|uniref:FERM and PDZ domain-containing protein 2 n=1 Tax=Gracilinanus agilis TaxID=191870 RepID=UPI001CFEEED6|nr:FERM and PDZ domain-containing protein 2 [Gracilinanus agilis]